MSAISVILLVSAGTAVVLCAAALHTARGLRADITALRRELVTAAVPPARTVPAEEIRCAVAEALADERDRELTEARAYWAEQELRDHEGPLTLLGGGGLGHEVAEADEELLDALLERYLLSDSGFLPAPRDSAAVLPRQPGDDAWEGGADSMTEPLPEPSQETAEGNESAELAAARRRHPSHPGYSLSGEPVGRESDRAPAREEQLRQTADRLARLAAARTPLADVRPGPLGTLDVLLFEDGTTLCLFPGDQEAGERLAAAIRASRAPLLMGGSTVSGAFALTFSCGADSVYLLADRVVATTRPED